MDGSTQVIQNVDLIGLRRNLKKHINHYNIQRLLNGRSVTDTITSNRALRSDRRQSMLTLLRPLLMLTVVLNECGYCQGQSSPENISEYDVKTEIHLPINRSKREETRWTFTENFHSDILQGMPGDANIPLLNSNHRNVFDGSYNFSYDTGWNRQGGRSYRFEEGDGNGNKRGEFGWLDGVTGRIKVTKFVADAYGYRIRHFKRKTNGKKSIFDRAESKRLPNTIVTQDKQTSSLGEPTNPLSTIKRKELPTPSQKAKPKASKKPATSKPTVATTSKPTATSTALVSTTPGAYISQPTLLSTTSAKPQVLKTEQAFKTTITSRPKLITSTSTPGLPSPIIASDSTDSVQELTKSNLRTGTSRETPRVTTSKPSTTTEAARSTTTPRLLAVTEPIFDLATLARDQANLLIVGPIPPFLRKAHLARNPGAVLSYGPTRDEVAKLSNQVPEKLKDSTR